jgi:hypothetical protein
MRRRFLKWLGHDSWTARRVWLTGFLAFFTLSAAWALATPLTASPDEPSHMVRAAATARGEFHGTPVEKRIYDNGKWIMQPQTAYKLPKQYDYMLIMHECYTTYLDRPASCAKPMSSGSEQGLAGSTAAANNPAYYVAVGWASLVSDGPAGLYAMRLVSAGLCAALLASAVVTAAQWSRRRSYPLMGLMIAATPMALFLNGSVNPNSIEICSAVLLWSAVLALFLDPQPALTNRRLARAGIATIALVNVRQLGPVWVLGILACALLASERGVVRDLIRKRAAWMWSGGIVAATASGFLWSAQSNTLVISAVTHPSYTFGKAARHTFDLSGMYVDSMIGLFGWLDTMSPAGTRIGWYGVVAFVVLLAFAFSRRREALALAGLVFAIFAIPIIAQGEQAKHLGYIWQGRYTLAIAVGLPLLATGILAKRLQLAKIPAESRLLLTLVSVTGFAGFLAFFFTLHRYAVGTSGPLFRIHPKWSPPGGFLFTCFVYLAGLVLLVWPILASHLGTALPGRDAEAEGTGESASTDASVPPARAALDMPNAPTDPLPVFTTAAEN